MLLDVAAGHFTYRYIVCLYHAVRMWNIYI